MKCFEWSMKCCDLPFNTITLVSARLLEPTGESRVLLRRLLHVSVEGIVIALVMVRAVNIARNRSHLAVPWRDSQGFWMRCISGVSLSAGIRHLGVGT